MPRAFEVKNAVAAAAEKQLWSAVKPRQVGQYNYAALSTDGRFSVTFAGKTAFATKREGKTMDGERVMSATINYPFIDDSAVLSRAEADLFAGYTLHELGHLLHTDFDMLRMHIPGGSGSFLFGIWNGLEDPRIEASQIASGVGGALPSFRQLANKLMADCGKSFDPCDVANIPFTLAVFGRAIKWGYDHPALKNFLSRLPDGPVRDFYVAAAAGIEALPLGMEGNAATIALAKALHQQLSDALGGKQPRQPPRQPQQPQQPKDGEEPEEADGSEEFEDKFDSGLPDENPGAPEDDGPKDEFGDDTDDLDFSDEGEGEGEGEDGPGEDGGEGEGEGEGSGDAGPGDDEEASEGEGGEADSETPYEGGFGTGEVPSDYKEPELSIEGLVARINKRNRKAGGSMKRNAILPGHATISAPDAQVEQREDGSLWSKSRGEMPKPAPANAALRGAVLNMLASPDLCGWDNGNPSGRLDRRALGKVLAGCENVFERRWETEGIDTAVTLLIDASGSMSGTRMRKAHEMANVLSSIFDKANVAHRVIGFCSGYSDTMHERLNSERGIDGRGGRELAVGVNVDRAVSITEFKPFEKRGSAARATMNTIYASARGSTPLHSAVAYAGNDLGLRTEKRRILFVLTDGLVDSKEAETTKMRVDGMAASGMDVIGIGLDVNLGHIFPSFITIDSYNDDLTAAAFKEVLKTLEKRNRGRRTM